MAIPTEDTLIEDPTFCAAAGLHRDVVRDQIRAGWLNPEPSARGRGRKRLWSRASLDIASLILPFMELGVRSLRAGEVASLLTEEDIALALEAPSPWELRIISNRVACLHTEEPPVDPIWQGRNLVLGAFLVGPDGREQILLPFDREVLGATDAMPKAPTAPSILDVQLESAETARVPPLFYAIDIGKSVNAARKRLDDLLAKN